MKRQGLSSVLYQATGKEYLLYLSVPSFVQKILPAERKALQEKKVGMTDNHITYFHV